MVLWHLLSLLQLATVPDWDFPLCDKEQADFVEWALLCGKFQTNAITTMAAVTWVSPHLGAPLSRVFPQFARQLQVWRRLQRGKSRASVPCVVAAAAKLVSEHDRHRRWWDAEINEFDHTIAVGVPRHKYLDLGLVCLWRNLSPNHYISVRLWSASLTTRLCRTLMDSPQRQHEGVCVFQKMQKTRSDN